MCQKESHAHLVIYHVGFLRQRILSIGRVHVTAMWLQGDEEETQQKPVWLQEDGQEVGSPTAANAGQLHLEGPTPTQPMDPQGAADFIGLDDDTPGEKSRKHHLVVLHQA